LHQVHPQEADLPEQGEPLQVEGPIPTIAQNRHFDFEYSSSVEHNLLTMSFTELDLSIHQLEESFNDLNNFDTLNDFKMSYLSGKSFELKRIIFADPLVNIHIPENVEQNVCQCNKDKIN